MRESLFLQRREKNAGGKQLKVSLDDGSYVVITLCCFEKRLEKVPRNRLVAFHDEGLEIVGEEDLRQRLREVGREKVAA